MGSLEDERLFQMVRDYIELGPPRPNSPPPPLDIFSQLQKPPFSGLQDVLERVTSAENKILEKILFYLRDMEYMGETNHMKKYWIALRLRRDGFNSSLCRTSWKSTFGRPSGGYEYIEVMVKEREEMIEELAKRVIVDMDFRSQFEVARPTPAYAQLINSLPCIFVGSEEKLMEIIPLLCSAAKQSLRERGLHIPPWRKATYMKSKWLSDHCKKITF
ncbi:hypothetical protein NMG60_11017195 [Bertholletia excelsa]